MTFVEVAKTSEIATGSMKHFEAGGKELCIVNVSGSFYALGDRCPHMNARLSMGTLNGKIVTCPLHFSRFDVTTGNKISGPVFPKMEDMDKLPKSFQDYLARMTEIMMPVKTYDSRAFPVKVEGQKILVDV